MKNLLSFKKILFLLFIVTLTFVLTLGCDNDNTSASAITKIYMFGTSIEYDGSIGGRSGADTLCKNATNKPSDEIVSTVHAFISVSASDSIASMPSTYSFSSLAVIYNTDGSEKMAENWADLLDGSILEKISTLGIVPYSRYWWSGSNADGSNADTCSGWTSNLSSVNGQAGYSENSDSNYINKSSESCDTEYELLCIGY